MSGTRNYFVPRTVSRSAAGRVAGDILESSALAAAATGKVRGYHLPLLASGGVASSWAATVLEKESAARERRAQTLLAAAGYDPTYVYQGVLDSSYPDHELIVSVTRSADADSPLERWDGMDWGVAEVGPDGLDYVVLDREILVDVLDAIDTGSAGVMLRPFEPKAWVRDCPVLDYPVLAAAGPPRNTGVMVALRVTGSAAEALSLEDEDGVPIDDLHVTLAYLGDMQEDAIDYQALHHAVATWVRRVGELSGEVSGPGQFTAGEEPVAVALVDIPALPEARQLLVRLLEKGGVDVRKDHGYTPHVTLAYGPGYEGLDVPNVPLDFEYATVHYGDDIQEYPFGQPVTAAGGAGPDIVYAIVDEFDSTAVLDVIRILPGPTAYRRSGGTWVKDEKTLMRLMGVDPPPVVTVADDQVEDVLAQVDAYDKEHPAKDPGPTTAAAKVPWDESKFKRDGGKFAKKDGSPAGTKAKVGPKSTAKGPKRPTSGPRRPSAGGRAFAGPKRRSPHTAAEIRSEPWKLLTVGGDDNKTTLDLGLGEEFWSKQPPGFREFARAFLNKKAKEAGSTKSGQRKASDDGRNEEGEKKGEANDGKRDVAKGDQRSAAQVEAQKKAAAEGGEKQGAANLEAWMKDVPPKFRKAMRDLVNAAAAKWGGGEGSAAQEGDGAQAPRNDSAERVKKLDKADRDFDLGFAKEGLGESRRREIFDRQIAGAADRLIKSGAKPSAIERVMRKKVMDEKRRREAFERQRKLKAEQERVRRLAARNRETDIQDRESVTAAGTNPPATTRMPGDLKSYWARGEGAAKIRWGTSGDFDRCTRQLVRYLPTHMVKGACANLHRLATGSWPGRSREH